ncbi:leucine--tRNA ligase [Candidatus Dojkabacteria bacterium]|nr:leucine--tRNA ligase [Candidatus Dojkabacteria bacterium]
MSKMDSKKIESKWQEKWASADLLYKAEDFSKKQKKYVLVEFPYPSGEGLHIGHAFTMTGADVYARYQRMSGFNVLFPMGWDAFGLPTENYAIKTGIHPSKATDQNTATFKNQMKQLAFSFDWTREVNTTDSNYYKWTQWIFIKLFEKGLAYKEEKPINWCPSCKTGLANEEVVDGKCERCGAVATKKNLSQWIVKITDYADRLISGLEKTNFIEKVKAAQINWIDRSEGAEVDFEIKGFDKKLKVYTTRPDTLWGATFMVVAPEHWLVSEVISNPEIKQYVEESKKKSELERSELQKEKTGVFSGFYAINPVNNKEIPIWISDFVLSTYGTGAIMAVPAHDQRDYDFAKKFGLEIIPVIKSKTEWNYDDGAYTDVNTGEMINSDFLTGMVPKDAIAKIIKWLGEKGVGVKAVNYHLRDWIFSRQHYWGEPIPMVHCEKCGWVPVKEENLPIELPKVEKYEPTDTGESPLANIEEWVNTTCPKCGGSAKRETDTMPNWAGSDWYFLRYLDPDNDKSFADMKKLEYWMPVDVYVGGDEHNTLHLLYSRFIYQFLWDLGVVPKSVPEPYYRRMSHGVILGPDSQRMSKSRGNVIIPDEVAEKHGVDVVRTYLMFMGPFDGTMAWNENTLVGVKRFIERFYCFVSENKDDFGQKDSDKISSLVNKTIKNVSEDIAKFGYNTAIAKLMEFLNGVDKAEKSEISKESVKKIVLLTSVFMPYTAEELWDILGQEFSVHSQMWPKFDENSLKNEAKEIAVQINGKVRGKVNVTEGMTEDQVKELAISDNNVKKYMEGNEIKKFIYVPGRIVTIVV